MYNNIYYCGYEKGAPNKSSGFNENTTNYVLSQINLATYMYLSPSLPPSLPASIPPSLHPSIPLSLSPSLSPSLPPSYHHLAACTHVMSLPTCTSLHPIAAPTWWCIWLLGIHDLQWGSTGYHVPSEPWQSSGLHYLTTAGQGRALALCPGEGQSLRCDLMCSATQFELMYMYM